MRSDPLPKRSHFLSSLSILYAVLVAGCGGQTSNGPVPPGYAASPITPNAPLASTAIRHVVIVVQENRSFDNLYHGFPGADSASSGIASDGTTLPLQPTTLENGQDMCHFHSSFETAYDNGKLDAFDKEQACGIVNGVYGPIGQSKAMYSYVDPAELQPYWKMARGYTLADRMFQSNNGPSFAAHQYLIAGQSARASEVPTGSPWGCDAPAGTTVNVLNSSGAEVPGPFPCFDYSTLGDLLDAKAISWHYYAPALNTQSGRQFSAYDAIKHIRFGSDWSDNVSPETQFLSDVQNGQLPGVSWVIPSFPNSDHPLSASNSGPDWVGSVVNAVGQSPYWSNTAIFVTWDDWGGWYDHVSPVEASAMGPGFRVPLLVISPYAKHGYVSHVPHSFGSILKFVEDDFSLGSLGQEDAISDNLLDCFDFSQSAPPYTTLQTHRSIRDFLRATPVAGPNDPD